MSALIQPLVSQDPAVDIASVVDRLAGLRRQAQRRRYPGPAPQLPSRQSILALTDGFLGVVYPRHFSGVANEHLDQYVAQTLTNAAPALQREIARELSLNDSSDGRKRPLSEAAQITAEFIDSLPRIRERVDFDIRAALAADPTQGSFDELVFCSVSVAAILRYRIAHEFYRLNAPLTAKIIAAELRSRTGIDIHPCAEIGEGFSIANMAGLTVGETAVIGRNVRLHAPVTLGESFAVATGSKDGGNEVALDAARVGSIVTANGRRHPLIEDNVVIEAGASLFGPIIVGRDSVIGRNVWVFSDVPPESHIQTSER